MVWQPQVVVVGVDGSEASLHAAGLATDLARHNNAELYIVTVVRPPEGWWGVVGSPPPPDAMAAALTKAQREVLDTTVDSLDLEGMTWDTVEEIGDPAAALANVCRDRNADVLVVGRRGAGLIERLVLGSVADRVVRYAPCPVLVVP